MIDLGSRLELLVDDWLIEAMQGLTLQLHSPVPREIVMRFDAPWEGPGSGYVTVMKDDDRYRMYYRGSPLRGTQVTCYAESKDGITWVRPSLGICDHEGSRDNNIILTRTGVDSLERGSATHNFAPFRDMSSACRAGQQYKAVGSQFGGGGALLAYGSADGIHWSPLTPEPVLSEGNFDSLNTVFWDSVPGQYVCYLRQFRGEIRDIRRATSADFLRWSKPEWLDFGQAPVEQLYTNAILPYFRAPHLYLGFPMRFMPERKAIEGHPHPGVSDGVFMSSRDGLHWDRRFLEAFIRPGCDPNNWTQRNNMPAWGMLPTAPEEISVYWSEHYCHPTARLRRGTLRTDGFVSVHATYAGGEFVTRPLTFQGKELVINCATSAAGSVRVEMQEAGGKPIPGFGLEEGDEIFGDEIERVVSWSGGSQVSRWAGRPIRLRFVMRDADLYSLRFRA